MITLLIKGDIHKAFEAADIHGVELTSVAKRGGYSFLDECAFDECVATAPDHRIDQVRRWYCEDIGPAPFPAGSLLHYSVKELL